jgi:hypothetical protein
LRQKAVVAGPPKGTVIDPILSTQITGKCFSGPRK